MAAQTEGAAALVDGRAAEATLAAEVTVAVLVEGGGVAVSRAAAEDEGAEGEALR